VNLQGRFSQGTLTLWKGRAITPKPDETKVSRAMFIIGMGLHWALNAFMFLHKKKITETKQPRF
jgi:hypothetical protein